MCEWQSVTMCVRVRVRTVRTRYGFTKTFYFFFLFFFVSFRFCLTFKLIAFKWLGAAMKRLLFNKWTFYKLIRQRHTEHIVPPQPPHQRRIHMRTSNGCNTVMDGLRTHRTFSFNCMCVRVCSVRMNLFKRLPHTLWHGNIRIPRTQNDTQHNYQCTKLPSRTFSFTLLCACTCTFSVFWIVSFSHRFRWIRFLSVRLVHSVMFAVTSPQYICLCRTRHTCVVDLRVCV